MILKLITNWLLYYSLKNFHVGLILEFKKHLSIFLILEEALNRLIADAAKLLYRLHHKLLRVGHFTCNFVTQFYFSIVDGNELLAAKRKGLINGSIHKHFIGALPD